MPLSCWERDSRLILENRTLNRLAIQSIVLRNRAGTIPFSPIGGKGLSVVQKHYMQGGWFARAVRQSLVSEQPIYPLVVDSDIFLKYTK